MGTRGPAPLPNEVHRRRGNPGNKKLPPAEQVQVMHPTTEPAPSDLSEIGKEFWSSVMTNAPWIADSDLTTLGIAARLKERSVIAHHAFLRDPTPTTLKATSEIDGRLLRYLNELGLTPAGRAAQGLLEVKLQSKMDEFRAKHAS